MKGTALFLGTGASLGVPIIGCHCEVCTSQDLKNKRLRSSMLLTVNQKRLLIDAGPDLRFQALRHQIENLDGLIFTHAHHDHTAGIDDLRVFYFQNKAPIPCLLSRETAEDIYRRYYFMFDSPQGSRLDLHILDQPNGDIEFLNVPIHYFSFDQIGMQVLGIRIANFAYVTDIKNYSEEIFQHLAGLDTLVLSALRFTSSSMHLTVDEAVDFAKKVKAKNCYLTHLSHDLDHEKTNVYLPASIQLAYDGLQIHF